MAAVDSTPRIAFPVTKIRRPVLRAGLVARESLEGQLAAELMRGGVVLLSAPGGWGKTVALARALASLPAEVATPWLSLDEDDDLPRLLGCLIAALDPYDLPWRVDPEALGALAAQGGSVRRVADELLNALAAADAPHGVLAFDDLHRLEDREAFELLDLLAERLPPNWTLAFATRVDPPLALARLRGRGELVEFRQQALGFSPAEAGALRDLIGDGTAADITELLSRTAGWPAGLRLCLSSAGRMAGTARRGDVQRHLFDYLAAEIFGTLPEALQSFLLKVSVLPELRASRCAAVAQEPRALQMLEDVERRGLFASVLDVGDELTLKLHDLFRDFLEYRLRRERPDEWPQLLQRAAAAEPDPLRRIVYLQRAERWADAERELSTATPAMLATGGAAQVLRLMEQFPAPWRAGSARLALVRGMLAWPRFEWRTMHEAMEQAVAGFERDGDRDGVTQARAFDALALIGLGRLNEGAAQLATVRTQQASLELRAQVEVVSYWATGAMGPADGPARHLRALTDILANGAPPALWYRCAPHFMLIGRDGMNAALQTYITMARAVAGDSHAPLRAAANVLDAWLLLWRGEIDAAAERYAEVNDDERWLAQPLNLRIPVMGFRCVWHALRGESAPLQAIGQAILADVDADPERRDTWRGVYLFMLTLMSAALDDWDNAGRLHGELLRTPSAAEWPYMAHARATVSARFALREGRVQDAIEALQPAAGRAHEVDSFGLHAMSRLLLAQALLGNGDAAGAARTLAPLVAATGRDELGGVLLTGPTVLTALAGADWQGTLDAQAQAVLQRWQSLSVRLRQSGTAAALAQPAEAHRGAAAEPDALSERLSEREREVLERIAAGDSNKLIARSLELSPHTVKRHVANILDKLAMASRGQAAAWYRAQGGAAVQPQR